MSWRVEINESFYFVEPWYNLELIWFWCISLKKLCCCSKFLISLTLWYRTKSRAIVPIIALYNCNTNYFKPNVLKFKTFISDSISKVMYNFCIYGGNMCFGGGEQPPGQNFFTVDIFRKNTSNYSKLMVEPYISRNLYQI